MRDGVVMLMGEDLPAISRSGDGSPKSGKVVESSKSESSNVESMYRLARPPPSKFL